MKRREARDVRLIDADKLIEDLKATYNHEKDVINSYWLLNTLIDKVDEVPTAYDADKVAAQLDREKFVESEITLSDVHQGYNAGLSRAIEIVKDGTKLIYQTNLKEETENDKWRIDS